jgi:hypothetical protein
MRRVPGLEHFRIAAGREHGFGRRHHALRNAAALVEHGHRTLRVQPGERVRLSVLVRLLRPTPRLRPPRARVPFVDDGRLGPRERVPTERRLRDPDRQLRPEVAREVRARDRHAADPGCARVQRNQRIAQARNAVLPGPLHAFSASRFTDAGAPRVPPPATGPAPPGTLRARTRSDHRATVASAPRAIARGHPSSQVTNAAPAAVSAPTAQARTQSRQNRQTVDRQQRNAPQLRHSPGRGRVIRRPPNTFRGRTRSRRARRRTSCASARAAPRPAAGRASTATDTSLGPLATAEKNRCSSARSATCGSAFTRSSMARRILRFAISFEPWTLELFAFVLLNAAIYDFVAFPRSLPIYSSTNFRSRSLSPSGALEALRFGMVCPSPLPEATASRMRAARPRCRDLRHSNTYPTVFPAGGTEKRTPRCRSRSTPRARNSPRAAPPRSPVGRRASRRRASFPSP